MVIQITIKKTKKKKIEKNKKRNYSQHELQNIEVNDVIHIIDTSKPVKTKLDNKRIAKKASVLEVGETGMLFVKITKNNINGKYKDKMLSEYGINSFDGTDKKIGQATFINVPYDMAIKVKQQKKQSKRKKN